MKEIKKNLIIKGSGGKGGGSGGGKEYPNTLRSRNVAKIVDLLGEGEIEGLVNGAKSIYLDTTPLQNEDGSYNFNDFEWETRVGLPDQPIVKGFESVGNPTAVNEEVTVERGPVIRQFTGTTADAVLVTISIPALTRISSSGNTKGTSVRFKIYLKSNSDPDYVLKLDKTIEGKCVSNYQESYRIELNGSGPYNLKVERVTPDSTEQTLNNKTKWDSYAEITDVKLTYPYCAYVALSYNSDSLSGTMPTRSYVVKGLKIKVPTNYDPVERTYVGVWDGSFKLAYSNNPAWCLYDMITNNRYGLGDSILENQVDKFTFYLVGQYCDGWVPDGYGKGGQEPRFVLNTCINNREDCYSLLGKMASVFRGMLYQYEQMVTLSQDKPTEVSAIYTPANVIGGTFNYEGSSTSVRPTVITVSYKDQDNNYEDAVETVQNDEAIYRYGWNQVDLDGFGCTSRGQAHRLADWYLYTELNEKEIVTFSVGLDSVFVKPGDVVRVIDPSYMGARYGGRIKAFTTDTITIDSQILFEEANEYAVSYITKKGEVNTIPLVMSSGATDILQLLNVIEEDKEPLPGAMWSIESSQVEGRLYRIVSITESAEKNTFDISAVQHRPTKYDEVELGLHLDEPNYSLHTRGRVLPPTDLVAKESLYKSGSTTKSKLDLSWEQSLDTRTVAYRISMGSVDGNIQYIGTTTIPAYTIENVDPDIYTIQVETVTPIGNSVPLTSTVTVLGKTAPPGNVQNFTAINGVDSVILSWDAVEDIDLVGYEIREGSWTDENVAVDIVYGTTVTIPYKTAEKTLYAIKAIDESGIYSEAPSYVEAQAVAPADIIRFTVVPQQDDVRFDWDPVEGIDVQYQVREGYSWETSYELLTTKGTTATLLLPARDDNNEDGEDRVFWIKAVSPVGLWSENARYTTTILKLEEDRNLIMHYNNASDTYDGVPSPEQPEPYRGTFYNMEIYAEGGGSYAVYMTDSASFGEHYFKVDLTERYRARSWLSAPVIQKPLGIRWLDANFRWESADAQFQWYPTGDIDGVSFKKYIYREVTDLAQYVQKEHIKYNFSLDETLEDLVDSTIQPAPADTNNIIYTDARMTKGLLQTATTKCIYRNVPFPLDTTQTSTQFPTGMPTFMFGFRIRKDVDFPSDTRLMELYGNNGSAYLYVGTLTRKGKLYAYCRSESGNSLEFDTGIKATDNDFIYFGILQTSATRTLYVYATIRNIESFATIDFTPTAQYDTISLTKMAQT